MRDTRVLGAPVVGIVLLLLGAAVTLFYVDPRGLPPALQNYWLIIHVSIATIAVGVLSVAFLISVLQLVLDKQHMKTDSTSDKTSAMLAASYGTGSFSHYPTCTIERVY